jgi:hypothetical protein
MKKNGAIELSIGTIVIIVLAMSMLILGLVLVKNIFSGATDIVGMTNEQLKNQVSLLFGEDKRLVVYPDSRRVEIRQGKVNGFGIGIKNLQTGSTSSEFSYEVVVSDPDVKQKCGVDESKIISMITTGRIESNIPLAPGEFTSSKVLFDTQVGDPLCTIRLRINVKVGSNPYATELMDITFRS